MAKAKAKSKAPVRKSLPRSRAAVAAGSVASPGIVFNEADPNADLQIAGASTREVIQKSETQGPLEAMSERTMTLAEQVADRWEKRRQKDGTKVYVSPFSQREDRPEFPTIKACQAFMNRTHKMQIQEAKLTGKPKEAYSPRLIIKSPKRTIKDLLTPKQAELMERMQKAQQSLEPLRNQALGLAAQNNMKASNLMTMSESMACQKVDLLGDDELKGAAHLAWSHGKSTLMKKIRQVCKNRGITLQF